MKFKDKNIIVTGATGGLGSELALEFIKLGANMFLFGRNRTKLKSLEKNLFSYASSNQKIEIIPLDFSSINIEEDLISFISFITESFAYLDKKITKFALIIDLFSV